MKPFTTLRIFHGNCCIVPPDHTQLKKIVLQEYILTITHKTHSFLLFSAFSHMSSLCQKFKALLTEEEKREWGRSESECEIEKGEEQPWHSRTGNSSVSCWKSPGEPPNPSVSRVPGQLRFGDTRTQLGRSWQSSQGCQTQHWGQAANKTSSRHCTAALRGSGCIHGWIQGRPGEKGGDVQLKIAN